MGCKQNDLRIIDGMFAKGSYLNKVLSCEGLERRKL